MPMTSPMRIAAALLAVSASLVVAAPAAFAQNAVDQTGTGGGPLSTITAPNTRSDGVTMPPGRGGALRSDPANTALDKRLKQQDKRIEGSICSGCR